MICSTLGKEDVDRIAAEMSKKYRRDFASRYDRQRERWLISLWNGGTVVKDFTSQEEVESWCRN